MANMASEHVPAFCAAGGSEAYLNAYDLAQVAAISTTRVRVDNAIARFGVASAKLYFLAVEVNGTGIRFYGDMCLVLKPWEGLEDTRILNGNSYDLVRAPASQQTAGDDAKLDEAAELFWGGWGDDLAPMGALKTFSSQRGERRLTTAQVSDAILDDEDYLEILRVGSFGTADVQEVRISAASVSAELQIAERMRHGSTPRPRPCCGESVARTHSRRSNGRLCLCEWSPRPAG